MKKFTLLISLTMAGILSVTSAMAATDSDATSSGDGTSTTLDSLQSDSSSTSGLTLADDIGIGVGATVGGVAAIGGATVGTIAAVNSANASLSAQKISDAISTIPDDILAKDTAAASELGMSTADYLGLKSAGFTDDQISDIASVESVSPAEFIGLVDKGSTPDQVMGSLNTALQNRSTSTTSVDSTRGIPIDDINTAADAAADTATTDLTQAGSNEAATVFTTIAEEAATDG